jgi:hypothetical protein
MNATEILEAVKDALTSFDGQEVSVFVESAGLVIRNLQTGMERTVIFPVEPEPAGQ